MLKESQSARFDKKLINFWKKNSNFIFIQNYFPTPSKQTANDYLLLRLHILFPQLTGWYATSAKQSYALKLSANEKALQLMEELNRILRDNASSMIATVDSEILTLNPVTEENLVALLTSQSDLAGIKHPDRTIPPTLRNEF